MQKLYSLNMLLAHRPWQMTREHVAQLTQPGPDSWSLSELVYSIILMCHVHSLSSFVLSCVRMEPDVCGDLLSSHRDCSQPGQESYKIEELMKKMSVLSRAQEVAAGFAATLHTQHHLASKLKARAAGLAAIQAGIDGLAAEFGG